VRHLAPELLLVKPCSLSGLIGVVGTFKNNSCMVGTFTIIYSISALMSIISLFSGSWYVTILGVTLAVVGIISHLAVSALALYWAVCLYSLWKELTARPPATELEAARPRATEPALGGAAV
jgi:hypothetical protein